MATTLPFLSASTATVKEIKSVCVFCGSGAGADPLYAEHATELGKALAEKKYTLVYGGGSVGLMGAVAKAVLEEGSRAKAIVPEPLFREGSKQIAEVTIVPDMHTRKRTMGDECDAFVVLPGGFGTMEEMLEMITWSQLNIHSKPILLLNTKNYFDLFVQWIKHSVQEKFVHAANTDIFVVCDTVEDVLEKLQTYQAPASRYCLDWVTKDGKDGRQMV
ncbi:hypothetical protein DFQ28_000458 [Apophysomyces sp. BC1034]|nr:hypothetical protein DFQ30_000191 [Apophysomyces sp. BC1015]KAG0167758.1 hypothetical protein DFQ29_000280 [Apophysomyces sp. BC1021]KAG0183931.1 hypothetical protein DFQ28_000458 [Apophysomyces sp. BC1034]